MPKFEIYLMKPTGFEECYREVITAPSINDAMLQVMAEQETRLNGGDWQDALIGGKSVATNTPD